MKTRIPFFSIAAGVMIAIIGCVLLANRREGSSGEAGRGSADGNSIRSETVAQAERFGGGKTLSAAGKDGLNDGREADGRELEDEETLVRNFDDVTDRWIKPSKKEISLRDVESFVAELKKVPVKRRQECVQRVLNLVPDENIMLIAGILMDKSLDKAIAATVFGDVLNRDENVKKLLLQQVFKDRTHPCWADAAWILDVTGQLPKSK